MKSRKSLFLLTIVILVLSFVVGCNNNPVSSEPRQYKLTLVFELTQTEVDFFEGENLPIPEADDFDKLMHEGYEYAGWLDSDGRRWTSNDVMPSHNLKLKRTWLISADRGLEFIKTSETTCTVAGLGSWFGKNLTIPTTSHADDETNGLSVTGLRYFNRNENNDLIQTISIPDTILSIDKSFAHSMENLQAIYVDYGNPNYYSSDGVLYSGNTIHTVPSARLGSFIIPSSITSIGDGAFWMCSGLTSITIPDSVTNIGDSAFYNCKGLTSITIPNSVTNIGNSAFSDCTGLTNITIPNSVTNIGDSAFWMCSGLTSITIPDSVTSIGDGAFSGCTGLTSITVGAGNPNYSSENEILFNKDKEALLFCLPSNTSVTIPDSVTSIGYFAFEYCTGLTSITIPDSVTSIGYGAFSGCTGLTSITIPNSVTNIGDCAFLWCTGLTSITIPDSVTSIGDNAFSGCTGLTSITFTGSKGQWGSVNKSSFWKVDVPATVVHCLDGDAAI